MNGTGRCGIEMLKKLSIVSTAVMLCGCGVNIMPGMQNLNTSAMRKQVAPQKIHVQPTVIPITPTLIADQHVRMYNYRVAPSDVLYISVWEHPEFQMVTQQGTATTPGMQGSAGQSGFLVNAHGRIYFPLVGYLSVENKTVDHVRNEITQHLKKYVPNPQVNVRVSDFRGRKVYVLGEVVKTGFLPITDQNLTIADALAQSGWIDSKTADPSNIFVIRGDFRRPEIFWLDAQTPDKLLLAEGFSLKPKDILYVSAAPMAQFNRVLDQLLPVVQTVWFTQSVVQNS
jgi:polysaccharide export outer membrane protein